MGMAASQARYLSLSARKTNTEYEGQQLNQQRVNLANQSADLFNQMLTMSVPVCPDSNNFTKIQYSYTDGINSYAIDDFYQIGIPNGDFNYVVSRYHYEDVYTGKTLRMTDPQIQADRINNFVNFSETSYILNSFGYDRNQDCYNFNLTHDKTQLTPTYSFSAQNTDPDVVELIDYLYDRTDSVSYTSFDYDETNDKYTFYPTQEASFGTYSSVMLPVVYSKVDMDNISDRDALIQSYGAKYDSSKTYYISSSTNSYICGDDIQDRNMRYGTNVEIRKKDTERYYSDGINYISQTAIDNLSIGEKMYVYSAKNNPMFYNYSAIGNMKLNIVTQKDIENDESLAVELKQILKDAPAGGLKGRDPSSNIVSVKNGTNINPNIDDGGDPDIDTETNTISMSRGQSLSSYTISDNETTSLTLTNPFVGHNYQYDLISLSGSQDVSLSFLKNGRLLIKGNNISITAHSGQTDDIILQGNNNTINTDDGDDILRLGVALDSSGLGRIQSDNNNIDTGSGNDHIVYAGASNIINAGAGTDTVGGYYMNSYSINNNVSNAENNRLLYEQMGAPDGKDGWTNQGTDGDCRLLALINSLSKNTNNGSINSYANIVQNGSGYTVTFPNYRGSTVDDEYPVNDYYTTVSDYINSVSITQSELNSYTGSFGDPDTVLIDMALNKLIGINNDMGKTAVENAYYNTISNYLFGNDKITYLGFNNNGAYTLNDFNTLWNLYTDGTISNMTIGISGGANNTQGIITGHAYSVKDVASNYVSLVNPWDDADVLNLDINTFSNLDFSAVVYGWMDENNTYGFNPNGRGYYPNGGNIIYFGDGSSYDGIQFGEQTQYVGNDINTGEMIPETERVPLYNKKDTGANYRSSFDEYGNYQDGTIYKFTMYGKNYYTTASDLDAALRSALREDATATNGIDSQHYKLTYYTADYVNTKISEEVRALVESDGKGRFSSIKVEDEATSFTLQVETITDEDAYRNAMNQYYYKQEKYDKAVADINAKTKIIQAEDRELQLRLTQLGTEQSALQTEMEACQKVVSKNVEHSFKTFSGGGS